MSAERVVSELDMTQHLTLGLSVWAAARISISLLAALSRALAGLLAAIVATDEADSAGTVLQVAAYGIVEGD